MPGDSEADVVGVSDDDDSLESGTEAGDNTEAYETDAETIYTPDDGSTQDYDDDDDEYSDMQGEHHRLSWLAGGVAS